MRRNSGPPAGFRDAKGRFGKGNPGRKPGARHRVTRAVEALLEGEAEALTRRAIDAALAGDPVALRLCLERIAPARREPTVNISLPPVREARDLPAALGALVQGVAAGDLTPGEAQRIATVLGEQAKALELVELEARISRLEGTDEVRDSLGAKLDALSERLADS